MKNQLKEKMLAGKKTVGTFFESGSAITAECLALGGLDYIIIDTEHGPFETESVMEYVCACERRGTTPLVRVKDKQRASILKSLDVGAMGLIIPDINSREEVLEIIKYGKYFPQGERGVAYGRGSGYGYAHPQPIEDYFAGCNRETMLIPQCETIGCLEDIESIAAVDGVDGIFIGPFDLSTALGIPGQFDAPQMVEAIGRILKACKAAGKFAMIYADNGTKARELFEQGFDSAAVNMDTILLIRCMQEMRKEALGEEK